MQQYSSVITKKVINHLKDGRLIVSHPGGDYNKVKHNRAENDNIKLANLKMCLMRWRHYLF